MSENNVVFLVAEKDMGLRASLVEMLKGMGLSRILAAATGAQAWSLLNSHGAGFILSGWNLSDITGLDLLKLVRSHRQFMRAPFVLVSELPTKQQAMDSASAGVTDFMCRPLHAMRLKERIDSLVAQTFDAQQLQIQRLYQEGLAMVADRAWGKALQVFSVVVKVQDSAEAHYHLGRILIKLARPAQAVASLTRAVELDPFFRRASQLLGETLLKLGRDKEAEPHLARAVDIYLYQVQDPESAVSLFKEAQQPGSDHFQVFDSLGIIYRRAGRYKEAVEVYARALEVNPKDGNPYYHMGRTYYETGEYGQAARELRKALDLTSGFGEAQKLLKTVEARLAAAG